MRTLPTLVCASLAWLTLFALPTAAQVPYDLSQALEYRTVWRQDLGGTVFPIRYTPNLCGIPEFNILSTAVVGRGLFNWKTTPVLDTTSIDSWGGVLALPIDYDGIPPLEYINHAGQTFRCNGSEAPFPMVAIDTVTSSCWGGFQTILNAESSKDVDGDGFLDVVCDIGGGGYTARVVMGGPQEGKGCDRVFNIQQVANRHRYATESFYRSATGTWRLVQWERDNNAFSPWLFIYDVQISRENGERRATFVKRDSLFGEGQSIGDEPLGNTICIVDAVAGKDWLLAFRRYNGIWVVERFDVTEGRFASTGERITGYIFTAYGQEDFGYSLGTPKPVVAFHATNVGQVFCYADNIRQPIAKWLPSGTGVQPVAGHAVINDQTGDGKPDILYAGGATNGAMVLVSIDPALTAVNDSDASDNVTHPRIEGDFLTLTLSAGQTVSADITGMDGRLRNLLPPTMGVVGLNRFDCGQRLRMLSPGAYMVKVRSGDAAFVIPVIR